MNMAMMLFFSVVTVALVSWFTWYLVRDNRKMFRKTTGNITEIHTNVIERKTGYSIEHFELRSSRGLRLNGYLKIPAPADEKLPVVLLFAGLFAGKDIIGLVDIIPGIEPAVIATMDYPYEGHKRLQWWQVLLALPKIRRSLMNSVRGIVLMVEMLNQREDVDTTRIYLSGASFGSFFGIAAAACDMRIRSVASLYGGGKIDKLVATNLPFHLPVVNWLIGFTAKLVAYPLEPLHYVHSIAPRPLLVVGGASDEKFPRECAQALYEKAAQPKDLVWFQSKHPEGARDELLVELTNEVVKWMKKRGLLQERPHSH